MQIILLEKVANVGNLGEVVKVKDGYARNYLIPSKKARRATPAIIAEFESRRAELEKIAAEKLSAVQALASKLEQVKLTISRKAGMDGRLFGSVGNADIAESLLAQGFKEIHRSNIRMPNGPLKSIGEFSVDVSLHTDVLTNIAVNIVSE